MKTRQTLLLSSILLLTLLLFIPKVDAQWNDPGATILFDGNQSFLNSSLLEIDGRPAIAYCDINSNFNIKYRRAMDSKGMAWGTEIIVDNAVLSGSAVLDMAIINGAPAVANSAGFSNDINFTRSSSVAGVAWNSTVTVVSNASTDQIRDVDLHPINGRPAIAYYDADNKNLMYVRANDADGTSWGTPITVASTGDVGRFLSLSLIDGRPAISYYDETNKNLMFVRANGIGGDSWGTPITVASTGEVGLHSSLISINGRPAIAYGDFTNKNLMYIRATNSAGSTWGAPIVAAPHYGESINLRISAGKPVIGYYTGYGDQDLRYVSSFDINGAGWATPMVVDDGSAAMGNVASMAVINGNPAFSYQDFTNSDLKYVRSSLSTGIALPVELTFFKGESVEKGAELIWQTASEKNNEGFEVQRSLDARTWETLDFVDGHGSTVEIQDYNYLDTQAPLGKNYYRLKQIDFDGKYEYSHVIEITIRNSKKNDIKIYPTMVQNELKIEGGKGSVVIRNTLGQVVVSKMDYESNAIISLSHLPKGQYFLSIQQSNEILKTLPFIKVE